MKDKYKLIPINEIDERAKEIAVLWVEGYEYRGFDLPGKHKLASDFMNYASEKNATLSWSRTEN